MLFKTSALFIAVYSPGSRSTSQCTLSLCTHWPVDLHHSALFITVYSPGSGSTSQYTLYHCVLTRQWIYITVHSLSLCTHQAVDLHHNALFNLHHSTLLITVYSLGSGSTSQFTLDHCVYTHHAMVLYSSSLFIPVHSPGIGWCVSRSLICTRKECIPRFCPLEMSWAITTQALAVLPTVTHIIH